MVLGEIGNSRKEAFVRENPKASSSMVRQEEEEGQQEQQVSSQHSTEKKEKSEINLNSSNLAEGASGASVGGNYDQSKESIRVLVRVRPILAQDEEDVKAAREEGTEDPVHFPSDGQVEVTGKRKSITCGYDRVFKGDAKQIDIFNHVRTSVEAVVAGINSTIFAYGQTGSGKTYTMLGKDEDWSSVSASEAASGHHTGLIPRTLSKLFEELASKYGGQSEDDEDGEDVRHQHGTYIVHCSYIQIYNNKIYDLLADPKMQNALAIREGFSQDLESSPASSVSVFVSGLSQTRVASTHDVLKVVERGGRSRAVRSTEYNEVSSRSHAILQVTVETREKSGEGNTKVIRRAKLNLVDLAGSEKWNTKSHMAKGHARELTTINKSLSALGNCISALSDMSSTDEGGQWRSHVPYRDSHLTRLLQDSLGGNTKTTIIACISPTARCADESISTLKFADRAKKIMVHVRANEVVDDAILLSRALAEIKRLKTRLKTAKKATSSVAAGVGNLDLEGNPDQWRIAQLEDEMRMQKNELRRVQERHKQVSARLRETRKREAEAISIAEEAQRNEAVAIEAVSKALEAFDKMPRSRRKGSSGSGGGSGKGDPLVYYLRKIVAGFNPRSLHAIKGSNLGEAMMLDMAAGANGKPKKAWAPHTPPEAMRGKGRGRRSKGLRGSKRGKIDDASVHMSGNIATALYNRKKRERENDQGLFDDDEIDTDTAEILAAEEKVQDELREQEEAYEAMQAERRELERLLAEMGGEGMDLDALLAGGDPGMEQTSDAEIGESAGEVPEEEGDFDQEETSVKVEEIATKGNESEVTQSKRSDSKDTEKIEEEAEVGGAASTEAKATASAQNNTNAHEVHVSQGEARTGVGNPEDLVAVDDGMEAKELAERADATVGEKPAAAVTAAATASQDKDVASAQQSADIEQHDDGRGLSKAAAVEEEEAGTEEARTEEAGAEEAGKEESEKEESANEEYGDDSDLEEHNLSTADYMAKKMAAKHGTNGMGHGLKHWNRMALRHSEDFEFDDVAPGQQINGENEAAKSAEIKPPMSSPEGESASQRPEGDINTRLRIWSSRYDDWRLGTVVAFDPKRVMHHVLYDDGEAAWHHMGLKDYDLVDENDRPLVPADSDDEGEPSRSSQRKGKTKKAPNARKGGKGSRSKGKRKASRRKRGAAKPERRRKVENDNIDDEDDEDEDAPIKEDVGLRLKVYSSRFDCWYCGTVIAVDTKRGMHKVKYDTSGATKWHDMDKKKYEILEE